MAPLVVAPHISSAQAISIGVSIRVAPPVLPVYAQPPCPTAGFLWTPGYWAYTPAAGYYWVPGVWVAPPQAGLLWTPGYWGFVDGVYSWHAGYWGPHVGFYGGVNYGFGYAGVGFVGGVWAGNVFRYNTAVVNVNTTVIHNTYVNRTVLNNTVVNRVSFNGPGGISAQPTAAERAAMSEHHVAATENQLAHQQAASRDRSQWASVNGGRPNTMAMNRVNARSMSQPGRGAQPDRGAGVNSAHSESRDTPRQPVREANRQSAEQPHAAEQPRAAEQRRENPARSAERGIPAGERREERGPR